ncbi:MOSC domain-containing protein [Longispora albida]|uniref:MOSC domain-containing protein n=1 Tax=Longispora albida TaxID=203523 RepID=UPI00035FD1D7|nr:MOSC domain-containing protein [Longispora albida]
MGLLRSVNVGKPTTSEHADLGVTGIVKLPAGGPVAVAAPGPKGTGGSGLAGDTVCDLRHHGGNDQAVYAYAREDLDMWAAELGRELTDGMFGENLTTEGLDLTGARIGERWRVGGELVLEVCAARIPCRTFAGWLEERGWVKRFTQKAVTGAYLRVIEPGVIAAGDTIEVIHRPEHDVTVSLVFRALTTERHRLPELLPAIDTVHHETREKLALL